MEPHTAATPLPPLPPPTAAPLPRPQSASPDGHTGIGHTTSTAERGSFCLAVCSCGWSGPARRSRDLARRDAARHTSG
ncbi:hypothetical protein ACWFQ8_26700 [Streptomyces sp. NPDC055254]